MKQQHQQLFFLILSVLTIFCFILTGIFVAERSPLGILTSLLGACILVGIGFSFKRKWRKDGE